MPVARWQVRKRVPLAAWATIAASRRMASRIPSDGEGPSTKRRVAGKEGRLIQVKPMGASERLPAMLIDDYNFRPITFEGVTFPATLMGISILEPVLGLRGVELGEWLWRLPVCCGVLKQAPAEHCARCAGQAAGLMLAQRQRVLEGIQARLAEHGFEPETTYRDWLLALQRIAKLSEAATGNCVWSAPAHPRDRIQSAADARRLLDAVERLGSEGS